MNSSPPPPSFTLPPVYSTGAFPITPSPTPPRDNDAGTQQGTPGRGKEAHDEDDTGRISMYVKLFDEMITTVLKSESYLFTQREIWALQYILSLPYEPHYLLTRLLLRRQGKIHPYSSLLLAYSAELGEEGVRRGMQALSGPLQIPQRIIDAEPAPSPSPPRPAPKPVQSLKVLGKRPSKPWDDIPTGLSAEEEQADPDLAAAIRESLWAAKVGRVEINDEGMAISTPPPNRPGSSRSVSGSSSTLLQVSPTRGNYDEDFSLLPKSAVPLSAFAKDETEMSLDQIMSCISAEDLRKVARGRKIPLNMLGNREAVVSALRGVATKQTVLGFTPTKVRKKSVQMTLPGAKPTSPKTKTSEDLLLAQLLPYLKNHAIQLSPELHALISRVNLIFSRTPPVASGSSLMLPSILVTSHKRRYPSYGSPTRSFIWDNRDELLTWERAVHWEAVVGDALGDNWQEQRSNQAMWNKSQQLSRVEGAKVVKRIWEGVWPLWLELVEGNKGHAVDASKTRGGLVGDRFMTAHVLTRIVYKGAAALGILHEYETECMVLRGLLKQRRWRRGKRGAWYDRLALVLMNHFKSSVEEIEAKCRDATQVCIDALLDEDTHLIYRPALSRRLTRLENKLDLPADERHISYAELLKCETRELTAPRVPDNLGQPKFRRNDSERERAASLGMGDEDDVVARGGIQQVGKSVWVGREGEVTVEGWVLEWWEKRGYKGFHSEGSIVTTLFGLLMWPVLFHPLNGAFETPYQTAPLDLGEDTFAPAREALIEARLLAMCQTSEALDMLREVDQRERARGTWAVGVSWEYPPEDLEEILQCMGGRAMAGICRMLCEEYRHRVSGVPDLIVWKWDEKLIRFIEVKGPGDNLSETQKVWIDVLLSAGVPVEVCRVKAKDASGMVSKPKLKKRPKREDKGYVKDVKGGQGDWEEGTEGKEESDAGEFEYESGDEGTREGVLLPSGKRSR